MAIPIVRACVVASAWGVLAASSAGAQSVSETQALQFGRIALGASSGSVVVTPAGGITCSPHHCLGSHQSASFQVTGGLPFQTFDISFSSGDALTRQGGSETLTLENLAASVGTSLTLSVAGTGSFEVGGDLVVPSSAAGGLYDGTYEVFLDLP